jgi:hypothetical protein
MEKIQGIVRTLQLLLTLFLTALIGNVIATNISANGTTEAAVNFSMFVTVLSWLTGLFGLATLVVSGIDKPVVSRINKPVYLLASDGICTLFTFIAAVVLAAMLKAVNCGDFGDQPPNWIAFGSGDDVKRCREIQASTVFMWFLLATLVASLALTYMSWRPGGGSRSSRQPMSQANRR